MDTVLSSCVSKFHSLSLLQRRGSILLVAASSSYLVFKLYTLYKESQLRYTQFLEIHMLVLYFSYLKKKQEEMEWSRRGCCRFTPSEESKICSKHFTFPHKTWNLFAYGRYPLWGKADWKAVRHSIMQSLWTFQNDFEAPMSPKGKTPWITLNGEDISDSQLCIEMLSRKFCKDLGAHLSDEERAVARAFQIMMEEHFYW